MLPIDKLLDKIRWDARERVDDYTIAYADRFKKELVSVALTGLRRDGVYFIIKDEEGQSVTIPLHRIKKGVLVWSCES